MKTIKLVKYELSNNRNYSLYFSSPLNQQTYFNNLTGLTFSKINVDLNDGINIETTLEVDSTYYDVVRKYNYAILTNDNNDIRYYFINDVIKESDKLFTFRLELDDIQTNYINKKPVNLKGLIKRAHLNRFYKIGSDNFYNFKDYPEFYKQIEDNDKNLVNKYTLKFSEAYSNDTKYFNFLKWIDDHVAGWCYIYLKNLPIDTGATPPTGVEVKSFNDGQGAQLFSDRLLNFQSLQNNIYLNGEVPVLWYPIYKSNITYTPQLILHSSRISAYYEVCENGVETFINQIGKSYVYTKVLSKLPPFNMDFLRSIETTDYSINTYINDKLTIEVDYYSGASVLNENALGVLNFIKTNGLNEKEASKYIIPKTPSNISIYYDSIPINGEAIAGISPVASEYLLSNNAFNTALQAKYSFINSAIETNTNNLSPLMLTDFYNLKIADYNGNKYDFDFAKLLYNKDGAIKPIFKYSESLAPSNHQIILRNNLNKGFYTTAYNSSDNGLISLSNAQMPYITSQFDEYLSNNKNYLLQWKANTIFGALNTNGINTKELSSYDNSLMNTFVKTSLDVVNKKWEWENMRNAPYNIKSAGIDVFNRILIDDFDFFIEEYETPDFIKYEKLDYFKISGYEYNRYGLIDDFVNIRRCYNHLEIEIDDIYSNYSNDEINRLINRFKNITFINISNMNVNDLNQLYSLNNYENNL